MAACLAHRGHSVIGVDISPQKVEALNSGRSPVVEARVDDLMSQGRSESRLQATTDATSAVLRSDVSFACVGTPSQPNGKIDLTQVEQISRQIGNALKCKSTYHTVVFRSTVPPGTTESVVIPALEQSSKKAAGTDFGVCYNPEFMREGSGVEDFLNPPYTILGSPDRNQLVPVRDIYSLSGGPIYETTLAVAEMVKYVSNAFHALKVSFANEIGTLARRCGVETDEVFRIFTSDARLNISKAYLTPGFAFGGSCLPKDLRALEYLAREFDLHLPLLRAILPSNSEHIERAVETILRTNKRKVGLLGLSFKQGTDDLRESPQVRLCKRLIGEGCQLRIWDPYVSLGKLIGSNRQYIDDVIPHIGSLLVTDMKDVIEAVEVVVVASNSAKRSDLQSLVRPEQIVLDLMNYEPAEGAHDTERHRVYEDSHAYIS